jgi:hypothetical protein
MGRTGRRGEEEAQEDGAEGVGQGGRAALPGASGDALGVAAHRCRLPSLVHANNY